MGVHLSFRKLFGFLQVVGLSGFHKILVESFREWDEGDFRVGIPQSRNMQMGWLMMAFLLSPPSGSGTRDAPTSGFHCKWDPEN